jgi:hypothetical protein
LVQTLVSDRFHKTLRVRVAVGAVRRNRHALHALRDFPAVTWSGAPPVATGAQAPEPLASTDPALIAVQAAIASANAYLQFMETP